MLRNNRANRGDIEGAVRSSVIVERMNTSISVKALDLGWTLSISKYCPDSGTHWLADHEQFSIWEAKFPHLHHFDNNSLLKKKMNAFVRSETTNF